MSDERGWYRGGESDSEGGDRTERGDDRSEAYRAWQRQQQLQRPWDRQQPWQQEAAPERAEPWPRPGGAPAQPGRGPDAKPSGPGVPGTPNGPQAPRGIAREDDFRPVYAREQPSPVRSGPTRPPIPPLPQPQAPKAQPRQSQTPQPQPPRPQAAPSPAPQSQAAQSQTSQLPQLPRASQPEPPAQPEPPFPQRYAPPQPRPDGPPRPDLPQRPELPQRHELPQRPDGPSRPDVPPLPVRARHGGAPDGEGAPRPPRPDMYSNEPPRPSVPRRDPEPAVPPRPSAQGRVNPDIDLDDVNVSPRSRVGNGSTGPGENERAGTERVYVGPGSSTGRGGHGRLKPSVEYGGGGRKMLIASGTVGVVALALIAYFATRPSGDSNAGPAANATMSQSAMSSPAPSHIAASATQSHSASAAGSASASPSRAATSSSPQPNGSVAVNVAQVRVAVYNGSGVNQRAAGIKSALVTKGFALATVGGTAAKTQTTKVYYPAGRADSAAAVANALAVPSADLSESTVYPEVTVVIGTDWSTGDTYPAG